MERKNINKIGVDTVNKEQTDYYIGWLEHMICTGLPIDEQSIKYMRESIEWGLIL